MIVTATQVTQLTDISASAATIYSKRLIQKVQNRILIITNNYFNSDDIVMDTTAVFNATARTIIVDQNSWAEFGFQATDDIYIYNSYRNDGVVTIESLSTNTAIINAVNSIKDESFNNNLGKIIHFSLVKWPDDVQDIACEMIYYDNDVRSKRSPGIRSRSLGPLSESYSDDSGSYGYPADLLSKLDKYCIVRLM